MHCILKKKPVYGGSLRINLLAFVSMVGMLLQGFLYLRSARLCSEYFYTVTDDWLTIASSVSQT